MHSTITQGCKSNQHCNLVLECSSPGINLIVSASLIIGSKIRKFLATAKNAVPAVDRVDVEPEADGAASPVAQLPGDDVLPAKLQRVFVAEAVAMKL
jgi:hypothetical protein